MRCDDMIRVLGPMDLLTPAGPRSVGSHNNRALLGALVVAAGHAVAVDQLQAAVWGRLPPESVDNSLQNYISRLRHVLGRETIVRADHTYRLDVSRQQIDALRFEDLLVAATGLRSDPERCRGLCTDALSLWRGEPFGDLADFDPFRLEAMRLAELRITTMELALEAEIALGGHEIAVAELESAVQEHPYRERLWYLLIEALRRDHRRVEALRACQNYRHVLAEAGLDPADEFQELEQHILHGDNPNSGSPLVVTTDRRFDQR